MSSLTKPVVERLAGLLGGPLWNRRSFLVRTALFGSAVAVAPKEFALEPRTAYQSICGLAASCHDGYTAFCCTINAGANFCPTGTFIAGWWKADRASFCGGKARYYVDCNGLPNTQWHCHCPSTSSCDKRHVSCVQFRYGNCHTDIAIDVHKSPVVCRLVTCTPPWQFDPKCLTTSFTDQNTVTHSAPCLPGPNPTAITNKWSDLGGQGGLLGAPVGNVQTLPALQGHWQRYAKGAIFEIPKIGLHVVLPKVWASFASVIASGAIGYPSDDGHPVVDKVGWRQGFASITNNRSTPSAIVVSHPTDGLHGVVGSAMGPWSANGAEIGIGYPTTTTSVTADGFGTITPFTKYVGNNPTVSSAVVTSVAAGGWAIRAAIFTAWTGAGGVSTVGHPTSSAAATVGAVGSFQPFALVNGSGIVPNSLGVVVTSTTATIVLSGDAARAFLADQQAGGATGLPTTPSTAGMAGTTPYTELLCTKGRLYDSSLGRSCSLVGPLLAAYLAAGGPTGVLGLPTSTTINDGVGVTHVNFEHGVLTGTPTGVVQS